MRLKSLFGLRARPQRVEPRGQEPNTSTFDGEGPVTPSSEPPSGSASDGRNGGKSQPGRLYEEIDPPVIDSESLAAEDSHRSKSERDKGTETSVRPDKPTTEGAGPSDTSLLPQKPLAVAAPSGERPPSGAETTEGHPSSLSHAAAKLPGGGRAPRKGDGLPWYDEEDEESAAIPALSLGNTMKAEAPKHASRASATSSRVDRDVADEVAFATLGKHAASLVDAHDAKLGKGKPLPGQSSKASRPSKKRSKTKPRESKVPDNGRSPADKSSRVSAPGSTASVSSKQSLADVSSASSSVASKPTVGGQKRHPRAPRGKEDHEAAGQRDRKRSDKKPVPSSPALPIPARESPTARESSSPQSPKLSLRFSDPASLSLPSASLSWLIHGLAVDGVRSLVSSNSRKGNAVRQVVESAYADAIQEVRYKLETVLER